MRKLLIVCILFLFSSVASADLVGYWSFNGSDGITEDTAIDTSGEGNDGTITGAVATAGKIGQALSFDGINDYVNCGTNASLDFSNGSFTITGWIYPLGLGTRRGIVSRRGGAGGYWQLCTYDDNSIEFYVDDGPLARYARKTVPLSTWTFFTAMIDRDSDLLKLSINGDSFATTDISGLGTIGSNADPVRIGYEKANNDYFYGAIDEVRIYNRALTETEVTTLYQLGRNVKMNSNFAGKIRMTPSKSGKLKFGEE